mmetsp:Transcript_51294/g.81731  ORF Transcript_51294/g.81731 Transcript_51294/m.81731 type:complete len:208 (+) Transcript_51294:2155-2778(+)
MRGRAHFGQFRRNVARVDGAVADGAIVVFVFVLAASIKGAQCNGAVLVWLKSEIFDKLLKRLCFGELLPKFAYIFGSRRDEGVDVEYIVDIHDVVLLWKEQELLVRGSERFDPKLVESGSARHGIELCLLHCFVVVVVHHDMHIEGRVDKLNVVLIEELHFVGIGKLFQFVLERLVHLRWHIDHLQVARHVNVVVVEVDNDELFGGI